MQSAEVNHGGTAQRGTVAPGTAVALILEGRGPQRHGAQYPDERGWLGAPAG